MTTETRKPHVTREVSYGGQRYVLRAWLDIPRDWVMVSEWQLERREELLDQWVAADKEDREGSANG